MGTASLPVPTAADLLPWQGRRGTVILGKGYKGLMGEEIQGGRTCPPPSSRPSEAEFIPSRRLLMKTPLSSLGAQHKARSEEDS